MNATGGLFWDDDDFPSGTSSSPPLLPFPSGLFPTTTTTTTTIAPPIPIGGPASAAVNSTSLFSSSSSPLLQKQLVDVDFEWVHYYNQTKAFEQKVSIIIPSIFAVVILVGLIGNLLVILVMAMNRQMRNSTNTLIIGLTCSDLMFLTLCVPFTAIDYASPAYLLPHWCCSVINYLQHSSAYFSVWTLTLMAGDRFLAVCFPVESMTLRTPRNTMIVLAAVYSVILVSQVQVGRIHQVYEYMFFMEERSSCSIVSIAKGEATVAEARLYYFSFNIFGYVVPLSITCVFYYFMLRRLWYMPKLGMNGGGTLAGTSSNPLSSQSPKAKATSKLSLAPSNQQQSQLQQKLRPETIKAKKKVTRLVLCVVIIWAWCWLPLNICFFILGWIYPDTLPMRLGKPAVIGQIASQVLAYTNSCLNPILYPLVSENFRKGFVQVLSVIVYYATFGRCCRKTHLMASARMEVTFYRSNSQRLSQSNSALTSSQHRRGTTTAGNSGNTNTQNTTTQQSGAAQEISLTTRSCDNNSSTSLLQKFEIGARRLSSQFRGSSLTTCSLIDHRERSSCGSGSLCGGGGGVIASRSCTLVMRDDGNTTATVLPAHRRRSSSSRNPGGQRCRADTIDVLPPPSSSSSLSNKGGRRILRSFTGKFTEERSILMEEPTVVSVSSEDQQQQPLAVQEEIIVAAKEAVQKEDETSKPCASTVTTTNKKKDSTSSNNKFPENSSAVSAKKSHSPMPVVRLIRRQLQPTKSHSIKKTAAAVVCQQQSHQQQNGGLQQQKEQQQQQPKQRSRSLLAARRGGGGGATPPTPVNLKAKTTAEHEKGEKKTTVVVESSSRQQKSKEKMTTTDSTNTRNCVSPADIERFESSSCDEKNDIIC